MAQADNTPLSITDALDLIRSAAPADDAAEENAAPAAEQPEPAQEVADDTPDPEVETVAEEPDETAEAEVEEPEESEEPTVVELPERLRQSDDGSWEMLVRIDGEESYLPLDEITENVQKREAVDRRFQEASTRAKEARETQALASEQLQAYQQTLMAMQQELEAVQAASQLSVEQEAQLADSDPKTLLQIKQLQQAREQRLAELQQQQMAARQQEVQYQAQRAMELLPDWSDPDTLNRERDGIVKTALQAGFTQEEINNDITDARLLPVFLDAWRYQQMQKGQSEAKAKRVAPKTVVKKKAPVAAEPTKQKRQREAMSKLSKTGKFDDALDVLLSRQG